MAAFAAVAENHSVMPKNIASDNHASWRGASASIASEGETVLIVLHTIRRAS